MVKNDNVQKSISEEDINKLTIHQLTKSLSVGAWRWIIGIFVSSVILGITVSYKLGYKSGVSQSSNNKQEMTIAQLNNNHPASQVDITGKVVDIFDNPRNDVTVIVKGTQQYATTDKKGEYHLSNLPFQNNITIEAYYGEEKDSITVRGHSNNMEEVVHISELLILKPVKIEAFLCSYVDNLENKGLTPQSKFEEENPQISLDSLSFDKENKYREIWCFVKIVGPLKYEIGKDINIFYEWYYNNEMQGSLFKQSVGVSPFGWRTCASKRVWKGKWLLKIKTKHAELARMSFEVY